MTSDQAPVFWPFIAAPGLPPTGAQMGIDLLSGGSVLRRPARLGPATTTIPVTNPNMFVFGKPGRGKSATVKAFLLRMMDFGYRALILGDPKDEYEQLCRAFGVEPFAIGPGLPARINPLAFGPLGHGWDQLSAAEAQARAAVIFGRWLTLVRGLVGTQRIGEHRVPFGPSDEAVVKTALADLTGYAAGTQPAARGDHPAAVAPPRPTLPTSWSPSAGTRRSRQFLDDTRLLRDASGSWSPAPWPACSTTTPPSTSTGAPPSSRCACPGSSRSATTPSAIALTCLNSWGRGMREVAAPGDVRIVVRDESWKQMRLGPEAVKSLRLRPAPVPRRRGRAVRRRPQTVRPAVGRRHGSQAVAIAKDLLHLADIKVLHGQDQAVADELGPAPRPRPDRPATSSPAGRCTARAAPCGASATATTRSRPSCTPPRSRSPTPTRPSAHNRRRADPMNSEGRRGPVPLTVQAAWSGTLLAALLQQVEHLRDPERALVRSALGHVNPAQPLGAVKLHKRVERCTRIQVRRRARPRCRRRDRSVAVLQVRG